MIRMHRAARTSQQSLLGGDTGADLADEKVHLSGRGQARHQGCCGPGHGSGSCTAAAPEGTESPAQSALAAHESHTRTCLPDLCPEPLSLAPTMGTSLAPRPVKPRPPPLGRRGSAGKLLIKRK